MDMSCFHVLAIVHSVTVNIGRYVSFLLMVFSGQTTDISVEFHKKLSATRK